MAVQTKRVCFFIRPPWCVIKRVALLRTRMRAQAVFRALAIKWYCRPTAGRLRRKPLQLPTFCRARIQETVVQSAGASLPEIDCLGHKYIPTPVLRQWWVITKAGGHFL